MALYGAGWCLLASAVLAPLIGIGIGLSRPGQIGTHVYGIPAPATLLVRTLTMSGIATLGAILLGLMPAALLGSAQGRRLAVLTGLALAPLLIPPQVYAYAWQIALSPQAFLGRIINSGGDSPWMGGAVRAGLISAAWLWPVVTLIVSAGWRSTGQAIYAMALLDTTPVRAFFQAVLPTLRGHLTAAGCLVFAVTLVEYPIPFLSLAEVYPTALLVLFEAGAPPRQVIILAGHVLALVAGAAAMAAWSLRGAGTWRLVETQDSELGRGLAWQRPGWLVTLGSTAVWLASVGFPAAIMVAWLRRPEVWKESFLLFEREWLISLLISAAAGVLTVVLAMTTALLRTASERPRHRVGPTIGMVLALCSALIPPAALGQGFVLFYNRPYEPGILGWMAGILGDLYASPVLLGLGLAARYSAIAVLIAWLAVWRRGNALADQARVDGADRFGLLAWILAPAVWPSLLAAGLIVTVLSMSEVVLSQMLSPAGFPAIAQSILNQMHYGQDDMVITTSLIMTAAGILLTQVCGWLLVWRRR